MNSKLFASLAAIAATTATFAAVSTPAQAFTFGNTGISFDTDTTVSFTFIDSHGQYQSSLGVYDVANLASPVATLFYENPPGYDTSSSDFLGTFGNSVTSPTTFNPVAFTFLAGKTYTLGLSSIFGGPVGTVFSTDSLNTSPYSVQAKFTGDIATGITVKFEDQGDGGHRDFNDFNVSATAAVPEPFTMAGVALAGAGLTYVRRRQSAKA